MIDIASFLEQQLAAWPMCERNYSELKGVESRKCGWASAQFNPARIASTGAKVDDATLAARPCFLCDGNRPAEQLAISWGEYEVLVNPLPIFPHHLTIPVKSHQPQSIIGRVADMCRLAAELPGMVVFYNGPRCGASAPDHMHFQAVDAHLLPIITEGNAPFGIIEIKGTTPEAVEAEFNKAYRRLPKAAGEEAMLNALCVHADGEYRLIIIPRRKHRPSCYGIEEDQILISPASVDLGGLVITPLKKDFDAIDAAAIQRVYDEVCYTQAEVDEMMEKAPTTIRVGIITAAELKLTFNGMYNMAVGRERGMVTGHIVHTIASTPQEVVYTPVDTAACNCEVEDVIIGVNFHWERKEMQRFAGSITIKPTAEGLLLINELHIDDYLASVISSEMSATSQPELLKAHAVISRSWVMAQIIGTKKHQHKQTDTLELVDKWYDHDDHTLFDVCADDHCQRYQGMTRQTTPAVAEAVKETSGQVLVDPDGVLVDARFYKCCGGALEVFESCWEPEHKACLEGVRDTAGEEPLPDLSVEENAREWILSSPEAFCNTTDTEVLSQVLNGYDQETMDFYRWQVHYAPDELAELIKRRSGRDFGRVLDMVPLQRGTSGRLVRLRIVGEKLTCEVGKELEIRRWLSPSHLYSSAFVAEKTEDGGFTLHGAGWGHGVGLCQIGAAMMAAKGYTYKPILLHYYPGSKIEKFY